MSRLLGSHFCITAFLSIVAGFFFPGDYSFLKKAVPIFLGGILYFTCLRMSVQEIKNALQPQTLRLVATLIPFRLIILPVIITGITALIAPEWVPGMALVSMMPAGFSSVAFTDLYGGHRVLALLLVLGTTMLCPFTVPLLLVALTTEGHQLHWLALAERSAYLFALITVPFVGAQITRLVVPNLIETHFHWWNKGAILMSVSLIFVGIASNRDAWQSWSALSLAVPLMLTAFATICCLVASALVRLKLSTPEATAFACGVIYLNNGISIAFAAKFYPHDAHAILPSFCSRSR